MSLLLFCLLTLGFQPPTGDEPAVDPVKDEIKKLEGAWSVVSAETDGKKAAGDVTQATRVVFSGKDNSVKSTVNNQLLPGSAKNFKLGDLTKTPRAIDLLTGDRVQPGIYELKGDELKICASDFAKERPKEFSGAAGTGCSLLVLKKVKK